MNFSYDTVGWLLCVKKGKPEGWFGTRCKRPNGNELQAIGQLLEISADWLLYGTGEIKPVMHNIEKKGIYAQLPVGRNTVAEITDNLINILYQINKCEPIKNNP